jgi:hypothetical protein
MKVKAVMEELRSMRILAHEALDLADRCHGGHTYMSPRSQEAGKCCEARMALDDLKLEFIKLSDKLQKLESKTRRSAR